MTDPITDDDIVCLARQAGLDLPAALVEVTARALAPDPAERFPSAAAMAGSLP